MAKIQFKRVHFGVFTTSGFVPAKYSFFVTDKQTFSEGEGKRLQTGRPLKEVRKKRYKQTNRSCERSGDTTLQIGRPFEEVIILRDTHADTSS